MPMKRTVWPVSIWIVSPSTTLVTVCVCEEFGAGVASDGLVTASVVTCEGVGVGLDSTVPLEDVVGEEALVAEW